MSEKDRVARLSELVWARGADEPPILHVVIIPGQTHLGEPLDSVDGVVSRALSGVQAVPLRAIASFPPQGSLQAGELLRHVRGRPPRDSAVTHSALVSVFHWAGGLDLLGDDEWLVAHAGNKVLIDLALSLTAGGEAVSDFQPHLALVTSHRAARERKWECGNLDQPSTIAAFFSDTYHWLVVKSGPCSSPI